MSTLAPSCPRIIDDVDTALRLPAGLHQIPDAVYHRMPICSKHALDTIAEFSPAHLDWQRQHPRSPTEAMRFGSALHTFTLEPDEFTARHPIAVQCSAILKSGKNAGEHCRNDASYTHQGAGYCGQHKPAGSIELANAITRDDYTAIVAMSEAIQAQPPAAAILNSALPDDANEIAVLADLVVQGQPLRCKGKIDLYRPTSWNAIADIKSTTNAAAHSFEREIENYGYHRQAALYLDLTAAIGVRLDAFILIAIEKAPPFGCAVYTLGRESISVQIGRDENERLLETYARCERSGAWPCYPDTFTEISLSPAAIRRALQKD